MHAAVLVWKKWLVLILEGFVAVTASLSFAEPELIMSNARWIGAVLTRTIWST